MVDKLASWSSTPVGKHVKHYTNIGFKVFPVHGITDSGNCTCGKLDCKNPGKHPYCKNGLLDATGDFEQAAALFEYWGDLNIGVRTGEVSGIFVLDVDKKDNGVDSLQRFLKVYGDLTSTCGTETGNGYHIIFKHPGFKVINKTKAFGDEYPGLDIRGDGGYIIAPPSLHKSGNRYKFVDNCPEINAAPAWMMELLHKKAERKPLTKDHSTGATSEWSKEEVERMLDVLDAGMSYDDWLHVGMALHSGGFPLSMWDSWSRTSDKYESGECERKWHGFEPDHGITMGTLIQMAQLQGWEPKSIDHAEIDTSTTDSIVKKAEKLLSSKKEKPKKEEKKAEEKAEEVPRQETKVAKRDVIPGLDPVKIPGLIGDTIRWIVKTTIKKQPELALLNTLAFAGAVFGRYYASPLDTRTNLYTVGVADTGGGKEGSRKKIRELAIEAGLVERIGSDDIRSDSGMLRGLMNNPSQIMMLDEFGLVLQGISSEKSPHYVRAQAKILLRLYSVANSVYNHGDYADKSAEPIIIQDPNLCIYGTTTEETYKKSLKRSSIESGELNRFVVLKGRTDKEYPDRNAPTGEKDQDLIFKWNQYASAHQQTIAGKINNSTFRPDPIIVQWGDCEDVQYKIHCNQIDRTSEKSVYRHLSGRLFENTLKIAMIFAIARNKDKPVFIKEDFDIAQLIVEASIEYLTNLASNHMSENAQEENNNELVNILAENGGKMGRRDLMRKLRKLKKREFDELVASLMDQELISSESIKDDGNGRPRTVYSLLKEEQKAA